MTFISYAQNFEDIRLWRALKFFENGFYIDVGANDPSVDSVTRAFYERGWRGINIEPAQAFHDALCEHRPNDTNLRCAAGDGEKELTFYDIPGTGLSTLDADLARTHKDAGYDVQTKVIKSRTLRSICEEHAPKTIHFLKIDVEGHEESVLRGMDFSKWRPWIVLVETPFDRSPTWERIITEASYRFIQFDGLNSFYLAEEHLNLIGAFETPPSFLDEFKLCYGHHFSFPVGELENALAAEKQRANQAEAELLALKQSRSWRVVQVFRAMLGRR
ncbi:FkbM family methyltransferase [Pseudomonas sp. OTU5201]|uniref:FkbM family methyltransferase n=1 Tax=Pseudomonas sp. OTU5201 TaxID=3043850 RepID=UPI00313B91C5